jgi:hypothetical protein
MPLPLIPLITAGASLAGNIANAISTTKTNQRQQDYNAQMYDRQRADALADWNMQNAYNSPSQQMQRFKEAGLNPNLIYGQMTNSPVVRSTDMKTPDFVAPKTGDLGNTLSKYFETRQQDLTIKNQEKALQLADANIAKVQADTRYTEANTNVRGLQYETDKSMQPYSLEYGYQRGQAEKARVTNIMEDTVNKKLQSNLITPLQADKLKADIENITNTTYWRNLSEPQKNLVAKTVERLNTVQSQKGELDKELIMRELQALDNFGVNKNFIGDVLKILLSKK